MSFPKRSPKKPKAHVVMIGKGIGCVNCGAEQAISFPSSVTVFKAIGEAFTKDHKRCKPSEGGRKRFEYSTPTEWFESWDTGVSSLTIFSVFKGYGRPEQPDVPHDPADFGRCYRLLKVAPGWRDRLSEVAARYPAWTPLATHWDELTKLYEEELPTGKAPKLHKRMRELLGTEVE